jgi:hypothetical protein
VSRIHDLGEYSLMSDVASPEATLTQCCGDVRHARGRAMIASRRTRLSANVEQIASLPDP